MNINDRTLRRTGRAYRARALARGITLVELMVSLVLGLMVVSSALGIFATNQRTYAATESLGRIQENARTAFELMAREVREAGGNPCGRNLPAPANVLNNAAAAWTSDWGNGLLGFDDAVAMTAPAPPATGLGSRVVGTDAIELKSAAGTGISVVAHNPTAASFQLNTANHPFTADDVLMVCDFRQASIFQMTGPSSTNSTVVHNTGTGTIGNCSKGLGLPSDCSSVNGTPKTYGPNSTLARLSASRWYIGDNGRVGGNGANGRALFRSVLRGGTVVSEQVAEGVTGMQITYLLPSALGYVPASAIPPARWRDVIATNITLTLAGQAQGEANLATDGGALTRQVNYVVTLRNRSS